MFHLGKRIVAEQTGSAQAGDLSSSTDTQTNGHGASSCFAASSPRRHLTHQDFDTITTIILKPSSKAQYSKVRLLIQMLQGHGSMVLASLQLLIALHRNMLLLFCLSPVFSLLTRLSKEGQETLDADLQM